MNILWIGGWAIPTEHMKNQVETTFPDFNHHFLHPHKNYLDIIKKSNYNLIIGYSLGATLLLQEDILPNNINPYCIAPFLNLKNATTVNETQLKFLLRKLQSDPLKAINDFYIKARLEIEEAKELPYPLSDLSWGIETLIETRHYLNNHSNKPILLGKNDPLIKTKFFEQNFNNLKYLSNTNHDLKSYLKHLIF